MKTYDVICPTCGHINNNLYLDETNGWMECEKCRDLTRYYKGPWGSKILPVFQMNEVPKIENYISLLPSPLSGS